jgi:hypothetical protein
MGWKPRRTNKRVWIQKKPEKDPNALDKEIELEYIIERTIELSNNNAPIGDILRVAKSMKFTNDEVGLKLTFGGVIGRIYQPKQGVYAFVDENTKIDQVRSQYLKKYPLAHATYDAIDKKIKEIQNKIPAKNTRNYRSYSRTNSTR